MNRTLASVLRNACLAFFACAALQAQAVPIVQSETFAATGGPTSQVTLQAFDSSLGTLDRAVLELFGTISATFVTPTLIDFETGLPAPYDFAARVDQTFQGIGAFSGFGFSSPARFLLDAVQASGAGETITVVLPFTYSMTFDAASNLTGLVIPSFTGASIPPPSVSGTLSMFAADSLNGGLLVLGQLTSPPISLGEIGPVGASAVMGGGARLTYDYTPVPAATPIPEPGVLSLLLAALLVACLSPVSRHGRSGGASRRVVPVRA